MKQQNVCACLLAGLFLLGLTSNGSVAGDPLLRMPGSQPGDGISLEGSNRCLNCHAGYNSAVEPGHNWKGSMMAQAARDPIWYACLTVALQDSIAVLGNANAGDLCIRCHSPAAWLGGRSDPTNASLMTGDDFDGLSCDSCHRMYDPFHQATFNGTRESSDWIGYWDEATSLSGSMASETLTADILEAAQLSFFNGAPWVLPDSYTENGSGQYFVSSTSEKRASFSDAEARHQMLYSRYHKSKFFCSTCHDVSNPVLANLSFPDENGLLHTEAHSAFSYFHVERTFSEFMLSAYGQQGGAATNPEFRAQGAPGVNWAAKCQDCHMRDVQGVAADKHGVPLRPDGSLAHPNSGLPLHDLTGGNVWISRILASTDPNGPVYDPVNASLLGQGPGVLTLDLSAGESPAVNGAAMLAGSDRAWQQLQLAATITDLSYDAATGNLDFRVQNNTGHKLISGFPEGRRMFLNIRLYDAGGTLVHEINPYDMSAGTLKGLPNASSPALSGQESHLDELVYEIHPTSALTEEEETFHFVLATGRYKDNRIPPKGFRIAEAQARLSVPVWNGIEDPGYYTAEEYAGGYDAVNLTVPTGAASVEVNLYYQGTSREYIAFLRDEINGTGDRTLEPKFSNSYIVQTDPFFASLKAWGDTMWQLWEHNHQQGLPGIVPALMTSATFGTVTSPACDAPVPELLAATPGHGEILLAWTDEHGADPGVVGYSIYYDQAGKSQHLVDLGQVTSYVDASVSDGFEYCYKVTTLYDADGDGVVDCESEPGNILCATPLPNATSLLTVNDLVSGTLTVSGKGPNKVETFVTGTTFTAGDTIMIKVQIVDASTRLPLSGASADLLIEGPETISLSTGNSGPDGWAEAAWSTSSPNRKGNGGTLPGIYSIVAVDAKLGGYSWDGQSPTISITLE